MAYSCSYYLKRNDFEGAVERFESTTRQWKAHWFEVCETIYKRCKEWAEKYVLDPIKLTITKINSVIANFFPRIKCDISVATDCVIDCNIKGVQKCYLIEFFDINRNSICSKVGTTTRTVQQRVSEELRSKTYKRMGAVSCVIHRVYDCKDFPAEGLESYFRAKYIHKHPGSFCKNDRFIAEKFDLKEADEIYNEYLYAFG